MSGIRSCSVPSWNPITTSSSGTASTTVIFLCARLFLSHTCEPAGDVSVGMYTWPSRQACVPVGGINAFGHLALTIVDAPGARLKPGTALMNGTKSPGEANCTPAQGLTLNVTTKARADAVP